MIAGTRSSIARASPGRAFSSISVVNRQARRSGIPRRRLRGCRRWSDDRALYWKGERLKGGAGVSLQFGARASGPSGDLEGSVLAERVVLEDRRRELVVPGRERQPDLRALAGPERLSRGDVVAVQGHDEVVRAPADVADDQRQLAGASPDALRPQAILGQPD